MDAFPVSIRLKEIYTPSTPAGSRKLGLLVARTISVDVPRIVLVDSKDDYASLLLEFAHIMIIKKWSQSP